MQIRTIYGDIFTHPIEDAIFVQCISADFEMGKGIASSFNWYFNTKNLLTKHYPKDVWDKHGYCLIEGQVSNLVTKKCYNYKPTLTTLEEALKDLKSKIPDNQNIAMPQIGCGKDKLNWDVVFNSIFSIFSGTNCDITIYSL